MKYFKTLIILLSSALIFAWDASSQTIPEKVYYERSHSLYNGEGDKMTKEEIKGLEEYGFDYDKWRKLNNRLLISEVSMWGFGSMIAIGGWIARKEENKLLGNSMSVTGFITCLVSAIITDKIRDKMTIVVSDYNNNSQQYGFSSSGIGLRYYF